MSGASEARDAIASAAEALYTPLRDAASAYGRAHQVLGRCEDLTDALQAAVTLLIAAEALQARAEEAGRALRNKLAEVMSETGATTIRGEHHSAHLSTAPDRVWVKDESLLPPDLIVAQRPKPDTTEIGRRLRRGDLVPGAVLAGNKEPRLVIRATREKAA